MIFFRVEASMPQSGTRESKDFLGCHLSAYGETQGRGGWESLYQKGMTHCLLGSGDYFDF